MGEPSSAIQKRVEAAHQRQRERLGVGARQAPDGTQIEGVPVDVDSYPITCNADMRPADVRQFCDLDETSRTLVRSAMSQLQLSARAYHRILKLARTIADRQLFDTLDLSNFTGIERFMEFKKKMGETPEHRYTQREYVCVVDTTCHYIITRCLVHDFFSEAGTPELPRSICDTDQVFFPSVFPDLEFSRGQFLGEHDGLWKGSL